MAWLDAQLFVFLGQDSRNRPEFILYQGMGRTCKIDEIFGSRIGFIMCINMYTTQCTPVMGNVWVVLLITVPIGQKGNIKNIKNICLGVGASWQLALKNRKLSKSGTDYTNRNVPSPSCAIFHQAK